MQNATAPYDIFFTITYRSHQAGSSSKFQFESTYPELIEHLDKVGPFECYPEFTLKGVIHYHIMLSINNEFEYYRSFLPFAKRQGFFDVQKIKYYEKVYEYCNKSILITQKLIEELLPLTNKSLGCNSWKQRQRILNRRRKDLQTSNRILDNTQDAYLAILRGNIDLIVV